MKNNDIYKDNLPLNCIECEYLDYFDKYRCNKNKDDFFLISESEECKYFKKREVPEECKKALGKNDICPFWCLSCKAKKYHIPNVKK